MPTQEEDLSVSDLARVLSIKFRLGGQSELMRQLRYFTMEGLLETVGSVHTGSGRKRLYPPSILIKAVVLLRLSQSGAKVGIMKRHIKALEAFIRHAYGTRDLSDACSGLKHPAVYFELPDQRHGLVRARLVERDGLLATVKPNVDFIVIQLARYL